MASSLNELGLACPVTVLNELLAGAGLSTIKLTQHHQLGVEEASVAAASLFLDGARLRY